MKAIAILLGIAYLFLFLFGSIIQLTGLISISGLFLLKLWFVSLPIVIVVVLMLLCAVVGNRVLAVLIGIVAAFIPIVFMLMVNPLGGMISSTIQMAGLTKNLPYGGVIDDQMRVGTGSGVVLMLCSAIGYSAAGLMMKKGTARNRMRVATFDQDFGEGTERWQDEAAEGSFGNMDDFSSDGWD